MGLSHIPSQCNEDVTSSIKNADYSQVSAMAWREKMTAVLLTSGREFSKKRRNRRPKNLKQAVAGIFEGCKKSRMAGVRVEGRSPGEEGVRARRGQEALPWGSDGEESAVYSEGRRKPWRVTGCEHHQERKISKWT